MTLPRHFASSKQSSGGSGFSPAKQISRCIGTHSHPFWESPKSAGRPRRSRRVRSARSRQIVRIANRFRVPLYPISTGRNLGYGGSAPTYSRQRRGRPQADESHPRGQRGQRLLPRGAGRQLLRSVRHIEERGLKFWVDVPDPGWGSPIGNALDRGGGYTRRSSAITSMPIAAWRSCCRTAS